MMRDAPIMIAAYLFAIRDLARAQGRAPRSMER